MIWEIGNESVRSYREEAPAAERCNRAFRPGILTALMGLSGAGNTTLMDVLSGRKTRGYIEGDIHISGFPKVQRHFPEFEVIVSKMIFILFR